MRPRRGSPTARNGGVPQPIDPGVGDGRRLPLRRGAHQASSGRSRRHPGPAVRAERPGSPGMPAEGRATLRNHCPPRRAVDSDRRDRGVRARRDGRRGQDPPHGGDRDMVRRRPSLHRERRRLVRMGHIAPSCRTASARRSQQRDTADLRCRDRRWQRAPRTQRRGDRGGQGKAGQDQDRLHPMGLDRPRSRRPARAHLQ